MFDQINNWCKKNLADYDFSFDFDAYRSDDKSTILYLYNDVLIEITKDYKGISISIEVQLDQILSIANTDTDRMIIIMEDFALTIDKTHGLELEPFS